MVKKLGTSENYSYNFRWTIRHKDGTQEHFRVRRCAHVSNKRDALAVEAAHRAALARGDVHPRDPWPPPKDTPPPTLRAFAADFLAHVKTNKRPGTHRFYSGGLGRLLAFAALADAPLDAITAETVDRYSRYRQDVARNSCVTVNGDLRCLRRALKLGVKWGRLKADDAVAVNEIREAPSTRRAFSPKEEQLYLRHASRNLADAAIISCDSGLRPEELLPLPWPDVDLASRPETPNGGRPCARRGQERRRDPQRAPHTASAGGPATTVEGGRGGNQEVAVRVRRQRQDGPHRLHAAPPRTGDQEGEARTT